MKISTPPSKLLSRLNVPAPRHIAKKKSFRSAPRMVRGRESERCTRLIRLAFAISAPVSPDSEGAAPHGKSQAMKLTAAIAMPTPKRTPARTRFEPPSPKAKVRPATTMATSERPRAIVLVKAVIKTLTAFSHGEVPVWAKAGATKRNVEPMVTKDARSQMLRTYVQRN